MAANNSIVILSNKTAKSNISGAVISFNATTNQMISSDTGAANFSSLSENDQIVITGSVSNDGTYTVSEVVTAGVVTLVEDVVVEAEGATITIAPSGILGASYKGDGFYGYTDGLHTVSYTLNNFVSGIKIQATLAASPESTDWFDVLGTTVSYGVAETSAKAYNFTGNIVWIRVMVDSFTAGSISSIYYNY